MAKKRGKRDKQLGKIKGFAIRFLPFSEIKHLDSNGRIKKILDIIIENNILILQGRMKAEEETRLINDTMVLIHHLKNFRGVELAVVEGNGNDGLFGRAKTRLASMLSGGDLSAITIIGPATIVKEIKRNPKRIELLLNK